MTILQDVCSCFIFNYGWVGSKPKPRFSVKTEPEPKPRFRWESKSVLRPH